MAEMKQQDKGGWMKKLAEAVGVPVQLFSAAMHNENILKWAQQITQDRLLYCNICDCFNKIGISSTTEISKEVAEEIRNDPDKYAFLKHLNDEIGGTDIDSVEEVSELLTNTQEQQQGLEPTCNEEAYQKCLNEFYITYFGFSMVSLLMSWWKIHETNKKLAYASNKLNDLNSRLDNIKSEYVQPVIQYHEKIKISGVIDNLIEYRSHEQLISAALDLLNGLQRECRAQQEILTNESQSNAMGAFSMGHSSYTSWNLAFSFPQAAVALKILSVVQGGTAIVHGKKAWESYSLCQEFKSFERKLIDIIGNLKEIKRSMKACEDKYIARIALWDYQQVSQWVKALGPQYKSLGEEFEKDKVDGKELMDMDHDDLAAFGIKKRLYRKRLLTKIAEMKN